MNEYTPEPVAIIADVLNDNGIGAPECFRMASDVYRALGFDAKRIDACLAACAGIPTEQLQKGSVAKLLEAAEYALDNDDLSISALTIIEALRLFRRG